MFIMSVAVGIALTLSYDLLRVFRRVVSHNSILIAMEDVCFWLIWTYVTLECIHVYGDGVLHWYMAVGILFGVVLFHYTISCALLKSVNNILYKVKKSAKKHKKLLKNSDNKGKMYISLGMKRGYGNGKQQYTKVSSISSVAGDHISGCCGGYIYMCDFDCACDKSAHEE